MSAVAIAVIAVPGAAQSTPHLSMTLRVERRAGVLDARACLSRLPAGARANFLLHRGLNVRSVRDGSGRRLRLAGDYNAHLVGEGVAYTLRDSVTAGDSLCVEYGGAFPVYLLERDDFGDGDYKGRIAFTARTVRAAEQAKWYPIPYDSTVGPNAHQSVTFRADVRCDDCRDIYLNGDEPKSGPRATFASATPVPMLMFAGEFETARLPGLIVVNGTEFALDRRALERLAGATNEIRTFYESWLRVPYGAPLVFIQHTLTEDSPRRRWGFASYPTIAFSNDGVAAFVDSAGTVAPFAWGYLGHEMGHYYFGTKLVPHGPYRWFLLESTAEYLSLQAIRHFEGDSAFRARISGFARAAAADTSSRTFDRIERAEQVHERYRYELGPLLLVALEERVGVEPMRRLLARLVEERGRGWDYGSLREAVLASGVTQEAWQRFEVECVRPRFADGCLARRSPGGRE
jgi:hypothetical protein